MDELRLLIQSRYPVLTVETHEEGRLKQRLASVCAELDLALFTWSVAEGGRELDTERILTELASTVPLSISRREYILGLQQMAKERFVPAR